MLKKSYILKSSILLIILLLYFNCSTPTSNEGGSSNKSERESEEINVSGNITFDALFNNFTINNSLNDNLLTSSKYKIIIIYNYGDVFAFTYKTIDVNNDGSFNFCIDKGKRFIAFLVNTAEPYQKVIGIIGIKINASEYWENINTSYIEGNINLGSISDIPVEKIVLEGNNINNIGATVNNIDEIIQIACYDDIVRFYKNLINNNFIYFSSPVYVFRHQNRDNIINWTSPDEISTIGYQIYLWGEELGDTPKLYPPSLVQTGNGIIYDSSNPIIAGYVNRDYEKICYDFITGDSSANLLQDDPPEGIWELFDSGNNKIGEFDFSCALLFKNSMISIPIPIIKINKDNGSDIIESIELKWYISNGNNYIVMPDNLKNKIIYYSGIEIADFTNIEFREKFEACQNSCIVYPDNIWHFDEEHPSTGHFADYIGVYYNINGISYRFVFRKD